MIARITQLQVAGSYQQALQEINNELEELVGMKTDQLMGLSDGFIIELLTVNEFLDVQRLWYLAELIKAEGDIKTTQGKKAAGLERHLRALNFLIEVAFASGENSQMIDNQIHTLFNELGQAIPEETLFNLYDYFDKSGSYKKAVEGLDLMLQVTHNNPDIISEKKTYLLHLLEIPEPDLIRGGLNLTEIHRNLRNLKQ